MSQDPVESLPRFTGYSVLLLDTRLRRLDDDFDRPTAATANLNVDIEHALESLLPRTWAQGIPGKAGRALTA